MTDHPFDEIAVEAHARSLCEREFPKRDWNTTVGPALKAEFINQSKTALTAACNSMKERWKVRDGKGYDLPRETPPSDWAVWTDKKPGFENECFYVTIFRHGE